MSSNYRLLDSYLVKGENGGQVNIFSEGIEFSFEAVPHKFYFWRDLTSYLYSVQKTTVRLYGIIPLYRTTKYNISLQFQDEELITFKKRNYPELDKLSTMLLQVTLEPLLSKYIGRIADGSTLKYDKLSIDKTGVSQGKKAVAWFDVESAKVENGIVSVYARNPLKPNKPGLIGTVNFQTPNAHVLSPLINSIVESSRRNR